MLQTKEEDYKLLLIGQLNSIKNGWVDGDKENINANKADIVNHGLKFAIEIKDDTKSNENDSDSKLMNQRYADRVKSANSKFNTYPNYKTLLVIRTEYPVPNIIYYAILGLDRYSKDAQNKLCYSGKVSKYSAYVYKQIGGFLIYSCPPEVVAEYYYYPNLYAITCRKVKRNEVNNILNVKVNLNNIGTV